MINRLKDRELSPDRLEEYNRQVKMQVAGIKGVLKEGTRVVKAGHRMMINPEANEMIIPLSERQIVARFNELKRLKASLSEEEISELPELVRRIVSPGGCY